MTERGRRRATAFAVLAVCAACTDVGGPGGGAQLGESLGPVGVVRDLTWVPGHAVLVYRTLQSGTSHCGLVRFDPATRSATALDTDCDRTPYFGGTTLRGVVAAPDGRLVYQLGTADSSPFGGALRTIQPGGAGVQELRRASLLRAALAVSPDGRLVAYTRTAAESLRVLDRVVDTTGFIGQGRPLFFSTDGARLFYLESEIVLRRHTLATGSDEIVPLALGVTDLPGPFLEDTAGLWMWVDAVDPGYEVRRPASGERVLVAAYDPLRPVSQVTWVPDGRRVAFWEQRCVPLDEQSCSLDSATLWIADRRSGGRAVLARGTGVAGPMAFTADGATVAYVLDGILYRSSVPH